MDIAQEVRQAVIENVADIFMKSQEEIAANMDVNYLSDFAATSLDIYPLVSEFEDRFDVELEFHEFQATARTPNETVDYLLGKIAAKNA